MSGSFLDQGLAKGKFLVVSNREPYIHRKTVEAVKVEKPAGGLTSAMDDALKSLGGLWVAWGSGSADPQKVDQKDCLRVPPEDPAYTLKRVWLHPKLVENYYNGYANQVLWPLCHMTLDRVYYRKKFWNAYHRVNQTFARAVLSETIDYPIVWVHDYHLCLLPKLLRDKAPHITIAHFWHIPWPDWSVFRICPQAREILEGLLGNDLIGFQIPLFGKNFMTCVKECLGAEVLDDPPAVVYQGRKTFIKSYSIGIDYEKFDRMASSPKTVRLMAKIKEKYRLPAYFGIGVDRLDYTKGLLKRLQAIDLFFEKHGRFKTKMTFLQVAIPTRLQEPYLSYKVSVEKLIAKINKKHGQGVWEPILYIDKKIEHQDLAAYYRLADFAVISSIYDGMNLVAKEFVASQVDEKGVLILSELAGAAEGLDGALMVNPYDAEDFSENIRKALILTDQEKTGRMKALRTQVREENITKWVMDILTDLTTLSYSKTDEKKYLLTRFPDIQKKLQNKRVILFLDYDGTLTPIAETPDQAVLSDKTRSLLNTLKEWVKLVIISGRSLTDVKKMVGLPDILYVGNHGAEICDGRAVQITHHPVNNQDLLPALLDRLELVLEAIPGAWIERKGITASIHYRKVPEDKTDQLSDLFWTTVRDFKDLFRFTQGKKVFEIRPLAAWNKGDALTLILKTSTPKGLPMYIGDDTTDEDAYEELRGKGISISIGRNPKSDYYLKNQDEVTIFLDFLVKTLQPK